MKFTLLNYLILCATTLPLFAFSQLTDLSGSDLDKFRAELKEEVRKADEKAQAMQKGIKLNKTSPMTIDKVAFGNAIMMLDVKKTLYTNFVNNPVIKSPAMQQALLTVMRKDIIQESDLAQLQNMADQVRAQMAKEPQQ